MNKKVIKVAGVLIAILAIVAASALSSCEKYGIPPVVIDTTTVWHLSTDIQPVFDAKCTSCHGGSVDPDLRSGSSYSELTEGGYVTPNDETCPLYVKIISSGHTARTSDSEKQKILGWIKQGALNN